MLESLKWLSPFKVFLGGFSAGCKCMEIPWDQFASAHRGQWSFWHQPSFFLWFSTWEGLKCPVPVAALLISSAGDGEGGAEPWQSPCWGFSIYFSQLLEDASAQSPAGDGELDPVREKKRILPFFSGSPASLLFTQEIGRSQVHGAGKRSRNKAYHKHHIK